MRLASILACLAIAGLGLAQPLPLTATIAGSRYGAIDIDVHPSGQYVAVGVSVGSGRYWIYQFETGYGQLVKKVLLSNVPHQVRYSPDGFWAVVSYGAGNCDIFRAPEWAPYASIRKNNGSYGFAKFDGVSRHLGIAGEYIYRMSDLQPVTVTQQGNTYTFQEFLGLEAVIRINSGVPKIIETQTLNEVNQFNLPPVTSIIAPYRSGFFADVYPTLKFYEYDTVTRTITRTLETGRTGLREPRFSATGQFLTYTTNSDSSTLGILGFDPVNFSVSDYFGYSGHLKTGVARGAVFTPLSWQLGDVRVASMTQGGDAGWLKMPEKWQLLDFLPHVGNVAQAASPSDSRELAVGTNLGADYRKGIRLWNVPNSGAPTVKKVLQSEDTVEELHYYDEGRRLAAFHSSKIELWDLAGDGVTRDVINIGDTIRSIAVAQNMACITTLDKVIIVNLMTLQRNTVLSVSNLIGVFLSPDASLLAVSHNLGIVDIYSTSNFSLVRGFQNNGSVSSAVWTKDGRYLYLGWRNGTGNGSITRLPLKHIWERTIERNLGDFHAPLLTLAPDGASISAYTVYTEKLRILSPDDLSDLHTYDSDVYGLPKPGGVVYFADGKRMAVATMDGPIGIMNNPAAAKGFSGDGVNRGRPGPRSSP